MLNKILQKIEKYQSIVLFRHVFADMDAIGSQFGLKQWIQDTYPDKQVYALGDASKTSMNAGVKMDIVEDEIIKESLAIILDTSNGARVEDDRYTMAKESIRIDHHVHVESFCDLEWIDDKACATCEMIAQFLEYHKQKLSSVCANLLYAGMIADSIRFSVSSVRKESLLSAAYLLPFGVDVVKIEQMNFSSTYADFQYEAIVKSKAVRKEKFLYSILEVEDYQKCNQSFSSAKEKVYALSGVDSIELWALFTRMDDGIHYSASLRSKKVSVREIATAFGGGGHVCACGIKNLTRDQLDQIIEECMKQSLL